MPDVALYYHVLGLGPGATQEQIKQAFRERARQWHPDTVAQDPERYQVAQEKMKELNAAYEFLRSHPPAPPAHGPARGGAHQKTGSRSRTPEEAEILEQQIRAIERSFLETVERRRRLANGLCLECGRPLTKIEKLLGRESHGRCG